MMTGSAFFSMPSEGTQMGVRPRWMPVFDAEGGAGGGADPAAAAAAAKAATEAAAAKAAADAAAAKAAAIAAAGGGPTDAEAKLLREVMAYKQKIADAQETLKKFEGIDPEQVKALIAEKAAAEAEKRKAEEEKLKAAGDFDALKRRMAEEHQKELDKLKVDMAAEQKKLSGMIGQMHDLTVGSSFASSKFIIDETILTPSKARAIYGDHFEVTDGRVMAYDRPRSVDGRQPMVDARGEPLPFDEAMKRIVEADADRDQLLRSKIRAGAGSSNNNNIPGQRQNNNASQPTTGLTRIALALKSGDLKSAGGSR
jgi:hypothetical protein